MALSVIILNWNAAADTIACVRRLMSWQECQPTIWLVDNASTDDSVLQIEAACPAVRLIPNKTNLGFAGGTNQGIKRALAEGDQPLLLLNNDAQIGETDVRYLLETLQERAEVGLVGPLLFAAGPTPRLISAGGKNPVLHHHSRRRSYDPQQRHQVVEVISGTAVLIRSEVFRQAGLLDEAYFFSTELADLCARAKAKGYLSVIDTRAQAGHDVARSSAWRDTLYSYYIIRNRFLYIGKFYGFLPRACLRAVWGLYSLLLGLKLYLTGQSAPATAVLLGLADGWRGRFGGQNERVLAACGGRATVGPPQKSGVR
jgi:hypothetical protein